MGSSDFTSQTIKLMSSNRMPSSSTRLCSRQESLAKMRARSMLQKLFTKPKKSSGLKEAYAKIAALKFKHGAGMRKMRKQNDALRAALAFERTRAVNKVRSSTETE